MGSGKYTLVWTKITEKQFKKMDKPMVKKIIEEAKRLQINDPLLDIKKLKGYENLYRIRFGDFRILFWPNHAEKKYFIAAVGHRKHIYQYLENANLPRA